MWLFSYFLIIENGDVLYNVESYKQEYNGNHKMNFFSIEQLLIFNNNT